MIQQGLTIKTAVEFAIYWMLILGPLGLIIGDNEGVLPIIVPDYILVFISASPLSLGPLCMGYILSVSRKVMYFKRLLMHFTPFVTALVLLAANRVNTLYDYTPMPLIAIFYFQFWLYKHCSTQFSPTKIFSVDSGSLLNPTLLLMLHTMFTVNISLWSIKNMYSNYLIQILADLCAYALLISFVILSRSYVNTLATRIESAKNTFNTVK
ncbi:hypothetical protein N474_15125 [Pseudoalteromonas luteoviolacea CPMOR-2]|nr:hypothetical protein N474_15125 [Pseudoalteromonas luteoviolacea CPMOR-2]